MEYLLFCFLWWLIGFAMFVHVCWLIIPVIKVKDLCVACIGGLFGPFGIVFYMWVDPKPDGFFNTVIYRKRD